MSLNVYLYENGIKIAESRMAIFIRDAGQTKEVSRAEWDDLFPGREPITVGIGEEESPQAVFSANITHNMGKMARAAGVYQQLWRPEEEAITHARQLIGPLRAGIEKMEADPVQFKEHDPPNGWGSYDIFLPWLKELLRACEKYPGAEFKAWR